MGKNLIVNLGPVGDIVRTTILLPILKGENYWVSRSKYKDLFNSQRLKKTYFIDNPSDMIELVNEEFDVVVSLNEEMDALEIVQKLKYKELIGVYLRDDGSIDYTPESAYWFDMSLNSKFGKERADEIKRVNRKTYSQIVTEMVGVEWVGQEYDIGIEPIKDANKIGLIKEVSELWPNKGWAGYDKLKELLSKDGYEVELLGMRDTIAEHIQDVNRCKLIVCGDSSGKELALALGKKAVVLFNCTSPHEIEDYGKIKKIVSPLYEEFFFQRGLNERAISAIKVQEVYDCVKSLMREEQD